MGHGPFAAVALSVGLLAGIAVGALALRPAAASPAVPPAAVGPTIHQPRVGPQAARPAAVIPAARVMENYARVVSNIAAAESRHDFAAKFRFERQLRATLTPQAIGLVYQERSRLLESMAEARANGNGYAIWRIGQDLDGLCGPASVKAQLTFC
jgi:hypothetical protein